MAIKTKGLVPRTWRWVKRILIFLFFLHIFYLLILKWVNPPVTLTQLSSFIHGYGLKRDYVSMSNISPYAKLGVIASEDQLFPDHDGFDFKSIEKAMKHNQKSKSLHGASTISQQVAKNVFLWQGRSWIRKALEAYFTFMIEKIWGKKRILEMYLNISEMGKGVFGIEAAAKTYFNKHARLLTRSESAMIASCLPNPKVYTIRPLSKHVSLRYPWILTQMNHLQDDPDIIKLLQ
ncbi:MAG: monofunctional biosynthetic peptidoglycan transglycosylase [Bacteroidota bacterium]|nr:monofunctional biosynthetic peptidoglycan transglycosylase [Bacteroidota bacterium]MDP4248855.1 monofunctional biosynthetic peptidoglycan transglycosylase [Bacteroidota bacterium]